MEKKENTTVAWGRLCATVIVEYGATLLAGGTMIAYAETDGFSMVWPIFFTLCTIVALGVAWREAGKALATIEPAGGARLLVALAFVITSAAVLLPFLWFSLLALISGAVGWAVPSLAVSALLVLLRLIDLTSRGSIASRP